MPCNILAAGRNPSQGKQETVAVPFCIVSTLEHFPTQLKAASTPAIKLCPPPTSACATTRGAPGASSLLIAPRYLSWLASLSPSTACSTTRYPWSFTSCAIAWQYTPTRPPGSPAVLLTVLLCVLLTVLPPAAPVPLTAVLPADSLDLGSVTTMSGLVLPPVPLTVLPRPFAPTGSAPGCMGSGRWGARAVRPPEYITPLSSALSRVMGTRVRVRPTRDR